MNIEPPPPKQRYQWAMEVALNMFCCWLRITICLTFSILSLTWSIHILMPQPSEAVQHWSNANTRLLLTAADTCSNKESERIPLFNQVGCSKCSSKTLPILPFHFYCFLAIVEIRTLLRILYPELYLYPYIQNLYFYLYPYGFLVYLIWGDSAGF